MATKKKMLQAAAGQAGAGGAGLDITEVFSTYLYDGTGSAQTITNGIDLSGEGGLVWLKDRGDTTPHTIHTTDIGALNYLVPHYIAGNNAGVAGYGLTAFNSDGFSLGTDYEGENGSGDSYASWTFRKAPKFFDCVQYTGTGSFQNISHNLGSVPGMIVVKKTNGTGDWLVYHRRAHIGQTYQPLPERKYLLLNGSGSVSHGSGLMWGDTPPTDTVFSVSTDTYSNNNGDTYVAYVFAHNNGDGGFGPSGDQDIIKCGSFPWGSTSGTEVNLGFEPQWILFKAADQAGKNWFIFDAMRGIVTGGLSGDGDAALFPNTSGAENVNTWGVDLTPTGFIAYGNNIASSGNIIYMAIRRGPLAQPESGTEVFKVDAEDSASFNNPPLYVSGFPVDFALRKQTNSGANWAAVSRLTGTKWLRTNDTSAEDTVASYEFDFMDGWSSDAGWNAAIYSWMWKRAPGFCDVVAYSGNSTAGRTVSHNLGVAPEMMWVKKRSGGTARGWYVYHTGNYAQGAGNGAAYGFNLLDTTDAYTDADYAWNETEPTDSSFTLGFIGTNDNGNDYIAYLFATLPGVSKVGSYTGNGSSQTIDCGFTSGARFVLIKRTDSTGDWYVWDTARGIVAGNDFRLELNTTDAQNENLDEIDPQSSGFIVNAVGGGQSSRINDSGNEFIFYAIA
jgi:hypothetical protein